jgi:hypothetical protein
MFVPPDNLLYNHEPQRNEKAPETSAGILKFLLDRIKNRTNSLLLFLCIRRGILTVGARTGAGRKIAYAILLLAHASWLAAKLRSDFALPLRVGSRW